MTYEELRQLIWDFEDDPNRMSINFGCDCGCGGDSYTPEEWDEVCAKADVAKAKLKELGITFENH